MKNPLNIFNKNVSVIQAVSNQTGVNPKDVKKVMEAAYQMNMANSEEVVNVLQAHGKTINSLKEMHKEEYNRRSLNKLELNKLRKLVDEKARAALGNVNQLDFDDLITGKMTLDEYSEIQKQKAKNTREYNKKLRVYKNKIWKIVKYHLDDVYGIGVKRNIDAFNVYMIDEIQDKIQSLSVYEIRRV
ncbi:MULTISPECIES: hypothetical protein [Bacillota]|uniref:Uncharacterized protein n=1 Tax=Finegoldia magna TaxID=1260 RepID=A0A943QIR8_FINMA|nr:MULTISPECIES: hypothetical protein [Bacillota]MBK3922900.1 hypothetical protein [Staphylococcus haemolyticus]MBS5965328.1 hypothetical protein [Finegoldia magna]